MLDMYLKMPKTIQRLRSGPSGPYMDGFAAALKERGYSYTTASKYLRSASHLGWFVQRRKGTVDSISDETLVAFCCHLTRCQCPLRYGGKAIHHTQYGAKLFVTFLRDMGVIKRQSAKRTDDTELPVIVAFRQWLQTHRGAAEATLRLIAAVRRSCSISWELTPAVTMPRTCVTSSSDELLKSADLRLRNLRHRCVHSCGFSAFMKTAKRA